MCFPISLTFSLLLPPHFQQVSAFSPSYTTSNTSQLHSSLFQTFTHEVTIPWFVQKHFHLSQIICPYPLGTSYFWDQSLTWALSPQPYFQRSVLQFQVPNLQHHGTSLHLCSPCPCESSFVNLASLSFQPFCLQHTNTSVHILLGFRKGMDEG